MTTVDNAPKKNYLLTTLLGSFWNILQFVIALFTSITVSILLTRYLGADGYGLFAYLTWFTSVVLLVINFGVLVTIQTWIPKYYFTGEIARATFLARKFLKIQLLVLLSSLVVLVPLIFVWHRFVQFPTRTFTILMLVNLVPMFASIINISLSTLLVSLQRFKQAVLIYITGQLLILLGVGIVIFFHLPLLHLLLLLGAANVGMLILFLHQGRDILFTGPSSWDGKSEVKNILSFSSWAYISSLLSAVIWDKSEFFFLGKYYDGTAVAIYGIAYTLANTATSILEPIISVFTTILSELVAKKDWERIFLIVRVCSKYFAVLLLPLITLAYALSPYVVSLVYGREYLLVAAIFPVLLLSTVMNRIFAPAWAIPQYMNDMRRFVTRIAIFAPINIALDLTLIPRFGVWGAVLANVLTQLSALVYFNFFVKRYSLKLFTKTTFAILTLNAAFFIGIFLTVRHEAPFMTSFLITLGGLILYAAIVFLKFFNQEDRDLLFHSIRVVKNRPDVIS